MNVTIHAPHVREPDDFTLVGSEWWDGPKSKCEEAVALLYGEFPTGYELPFISMDLVVVVCPHCDGPDRSDSARRR